MTSKTNSGYRNISLVVLTGLLLSGISLFLFGHVAEDLLEQDTMVRFDLAFASELHRMVMNNPTVIEFFRFISLYGFRMILVLGVIFALVFIAQKRWFYLLIWAVTLIGGDFLNFLIKSIFARARPEFADPFAQEIGFSFPSGHAMLSFIAYGMAAYLLCLYVKNHYARILIVFVAVMLILLIGISRLYLGVHYLSDVVGGFLAGGMWLATCITAVRIYRHEHVPSQRSPALGTFQGERIDAGTGSRG
jgi:membrane-associated phospholipid phosphatase